MATLYKSQYDPITGKTTNTQSESNLPVIPTDTLTNPPPAIKLPEPTAGYSAQVPNTETPSLDSLFKQYLDSQPTPTPTTDLYNQALTDTGVKEKQQTVNTYTAQLNQINAELQANKLKQSERLASAGEIGGAQAKLERDAAIRALPISAQLSAAQGDLTTATNNLNTLFKLKSDDATNAYNYKKAQIEAVYNFATTKEKSRLDALKVEEQNKFTEKMNILDAQQAQDLAKFTAGLKTQETSGENNTYKSEIATTGIQAINGLMNIAVSSPGIFGKTAALPLPDFVRSDAFRNYKAQLDFLKGNIIPAALTAMREASKTGGALGQVSDREGAWLGSSLGALDMTQSPEAVQKQLVDIKQHLKTWQNAVDKYGGTIPTGKTVTAPDGSQIIITD